MTASTGNFDVAVHSNTNSLAPEVAPKVLWGQGTPDGDLACFQDQQKGTLYFQVDATDDAGHVWVKVDEGNDDNDWVLLAMAGNAKIVNADISTSAGIVGSKLAANARKRYITNRTTFNIDNGAGTTVDEVIFVPVSAITVTAVRAVYAEATATTGAASANFKLGTAAGGAQVVAATALEVSKAIGAVTSATIANGAVAAGTPLWVRHTGVATTVVGTYWIEVEFTVDD